METMLVPLDGTPAAEHVLAYVRLLAPLLEARIQLLRVISHGGLAATFDEVVVTQRTSDQTLYQEALRYLEAQAALLQADGFEVGVEVCEGQPAARIAAAASEIQAALVLLAAYDTPITHWPRGSVIDSIIQACDSPVLVVPARVRVAQSVQLRRVLVPLDGSAFARRALPLAVRLVTRAQAALIVLTAVPPATSGHQMQLLDSFTNYDQMLIALRPYLLEELGDYLEQLEAQQIAVTPRVVDGFAAESILSDADRRGADLIIMATHGYGGMRRLIPGSVAERVLHATTTPVILITVHD